MKEMGGPLFKKGFGRPQFRKESKCTMFLKIKSKRWQWMKSNIAETELKNRNRQRDQVFCDLWGLFIDQNEIQLGCLTWKKLVVRTGRQFKVYAFRLFSTWKGKKKKEGGLWQIYGTCRRTYCWDSHLLFSWPLGNQTLQLSSSICHHLVCKLAPSFAFEMPHPSDTLLDTYLYMAALRG